MKLAGNSLMFSALTATTLIKSVDLRGEMACNMFQRSFNEGTKLTSDCLRGHSHGWFQAALGEKKPRLIKETNAKRGQSCVWGEIESEALR